MVVLLFLIGLVWSPFEPDPPPADPSGAPTGTVSWPDGDWNVLEGTVRSASSAGVDTLPMGDAMAAIGRSLVGTAYVTGTLEVEGPERLVINLHALDCVTFVENVYALATVVKAGVAERLADRAAVETEYEQVLVALRYRNGYLDGYPSRLHYFTDWIANGEHKRMLTDVTAELGGIEDREPIDFMSTHPDAYRQLADPGVLKDVRSVEARLTSQGRHYVPQDGIAAVESRIRDGDIIAVTSTVPGLDVAHTGLALWVDGSLRLLHAPLVGEVVQISDVSLSERIRGIAGQDGIIVARPAEPFVVGTRPSRGGD